MGSIEDVCKSFVVFSVGGREIGVGGGAGVGKLLESGKTEVVDFALCPVDVVEFVGSLALGVDGGTVGADVTAGIGETGAGVVSGVDGGTAASVVVAEAVAGEGGDVGLTGTSMILGSAAASGGREVTLKL